MSTDKRRANLRQVIAADLFANVGKSGFFYGLVRSIIDPGFGTVLGYRLVATLYGTPFEQLGRLLWRFHIMITGCHISPRATIGPGFHLPRPIGVCIGVGAELGTSVTVHQNVTIGRNRDVNLYPKIGDGAFISANSVVVGGITVGRNSVIGAGSIVLSDVPEGAVVFGNPARRIWSKTSEVSADRENPSD